jgi:predicted nucleic acid-binding protein
MTVVIADTSPLNYLVLIGQIEILRRLYGKELAETNFRMSRSLIEDLLVEDSERRRQNNK